MRADRRLPLRVALPMFFLVGAGALIVETTWMRWLRGIMGATAPAVSASLVALALGQLLGAVLGARVASRSRVPLRVFGSIQLLAVVFALLVEPLLGVATGFVDGAGASSVAWRTGGRLAASLAATLPASAAIGAALPLLVAATSNRTDELGPKGTALYAADLLGAALGAGLTTFWLPVVLGVRGAYFVGAAMLATVGLASLLVLKRTPLGAAREDTFAANRVWPTPGVALISLGSGFGVFAAQLLFHQAFGRVLDQSTFALGAVLVTTLSSLALGAALVTRLQSRLSATTLLTGAAAVAAIAFVFFPAAFTAATDGLSYLVSPAQSHSYVPRMMVLCALTAGPALIAAAAVLPALFVLTGERAEGDGKVAGHLAGGLLAANTIGAIAGALVAPYVLLPHLSLWPSFLIVAIVYAIIASVAAWSWRYAWAVAITLGAVLALAAPWRIPPLKLARGDELLHTVMSAQGLVAVVSRGGDRLIQTDNHYILGGTADAVHQERQGHLPLLLHPKPKRVAFIGTATGSSASAAFSYDVDALVTVEIMPGVTEAARNFFASSNAGVFDDSRTRVIADDARSFLRRDGELYDVIVGDLFVPWRSETGSLYSREHFSRTKERLAPGGLLCQWLPLYQLAPLELESILATFLDVFPNAQVFRGDFYGAHTIVALIGGADAVPDLAAAAFRTTALAKKGVEDRWVTHPLGLFALYVGPLASLSDQLADTPRNTENRPVVEFASARNPARHSGGTEWTAAGEPFLRLSDIIRRSGGLASVEQRRASAGGYALQAASTYWVLDRAEEASRALAQAVAALPPDLLADADPDPTAADVWHVGPAN